MATKKKMLMSSAGAAGAGGGAALDITDVFSTYLYEGTGATQSINNGIALGDFGRGTSTLFGDGAFLNRTSDLTGNADGKTLTLSVWIFPEEDANQKFFAASNSSGGERVSLSLDDTQRLALSLHNSSGTRLLNLESRATQGAGLPLKVWSHVLISVDLSDTSKRHLYINDAIPSHVDWAQYNNGTVDFTQPKWGVAGSATTASDIERMAHLYFDYTYRDLSVASNRRHFIDANGGSTSSSTQSALNPIIYLPLTEDYTTGKNLGTGGDFTVNGSPTVLNTGTEYEDGYGEGGLVWLKDRDNSGNHALFDTERGAGVLLQSNVNLGQYSGGTDLSSFNSNGFTLGSTSFIALNTSGTNYASWTFRKAPKFFDVVTWTGTGSAMTIDHNLGQVPGMIIVKSTSATHNWAVWHREFTGTTDYIRLNLTNAKTDSASVFGDGSQALTPTSTQFFVGGNNQVSGEVGGTYVAYLFAHNDGDGGFGPDGSDIIKCGSYTGNGSTTGPEIDLGFEPQWLLIKNTGTTSQWRMMDNMRGLPVGGTDISLEANEPNSETTDTNTANVDIKPNGFKITTTRGDWNNNGNTIIYMAIRRGPLAQPESATEVFDVQTYTGSGTTTRDFNSSTGVIDLAFRMRRDSGGGNSSWICPRLTERVMRPNLTNAEEPTSDADINFDDMSGYYVSNTGDQNFGWNVSGSTQVNWMWKRAPGYFDVVAYNGDEVAGRTVSHNLGVAPEMMWVKKRNGTSNWFVYNKDLGNNANLKLNLTNASATSTAFWNDTTPTESAFTLGNSTNVNGTGDTYIAYLFASLPGISKVGSWTMTSGDNNIDCGFTSGARFVLIKDASASGNWIVWDSVRGIVAGNDPYLDLNSTNAEYTTFDYIDPLSSGFTITSTYANFYAGNTYIFYAIA